MATKVTIADIAAEVGTSPATVSRVLNDTDYPVSEELRRRVLAAAKKHRYTPVAQRSRRKRLHHEIGVIVPTVTNPYFMSIVMGIEFEAKRNDYSVLTYNSLRDAHSEERYTNSLLGRQLDGLILFPMGQSSHTIMDRIQQLSPVVCIDQYLEGFSGSKVGFNYLGAGTMAVEHLVSLGHREIAFLTTPFTRPSRREMFEGYKLGLSRNGIPFNPAWVLEAPFEQEQQDSIYEFAAGKELAGRFLQMEDRPRAIVAINDLTAYGIVNKLQSRGVAIPGEVSVIGMDNLETSAMIYPPLTTIYQPANETGRLACKLLLDRIVSKEELTPLSITLEPELVVRKSTGRVAGSV